MYIYVTYHMIDKGIITMTDLYIMTVKKYHNAYKCY